jgi:hypothetical protein
MLVTAVAVFPILNAKNSYSPFFDQVGMNCATGSYMPRCLTIDVFLLSSFIWTVMFRSSGMTKKLFQLLKSSARVSVIPHHRTSERLKKSFDLIPHQLITPSSEKQPLFW